MCGGRGGGEVRAEGVGGGEVRMEVIPDYYSPFGTT